GMKVLPADLYVDEVEISIELFEINQASVSVKLKTVSLDLLLAESDYISVHVPFSGERPLLGRQEINKMKDGVILVNTARGGIIGEDALLEALNSGKVRGAALDVFNGEPSPNQALLTHPNMSLSPHIGAATDEAQSNIGKELADQIIAFFDK
ncbi:MAG: 3-phosphoglycerate dehydrogenase, partial [Saprospiraceae bacterium]|nr:3-phosphoglycerate dehydrogenase [Saprospiraceae bacterium]